MVVGDEPMAAGVFIIIMRQNSRFVTGREFWRISCIKFLNLYYDLKVIRHLKPCGLFSEK